VEIRTLFFAAYRDALGESALEVDVPGDATVSDLVRLLRQRGAPFDRLPAEPAVAVNRAYASPDLKLSAGDEVAFIPPVAGG
jgi:molybdopterin converting factor subunit 1